jgi:hypothetical protein
LTVKEFLERAPDALKSAQDAVLRTRTSLDNWLVTIASTLLALPALLGKGVVYPSCCLWVTFVVADSFLVLSIVLIMIRSEVFLARVNRGASAIAEISLRLSRSEATEPVPADLDAQWRQAFEGARKFRSVEPWLSRAALLSFLIGIVLLSIVVMVQSQPSKVTTSANNRLQATVGGLGVDMPARWAFAHRA